MNTPSLYRTIAAAAVVCLVVASRPDHTRADDVAAAARAYSKAQAAELADQPARAAAMYELADRTAPAAEALRGAARTRLAARDHELAATHALELERRYPDDPASKALADRILSRVAGSLTLVSVRCMEPCTVAVDGAAVGLDARDRHQFYTRPGTGKLVARFAGGERRSRTLELIAGASLELVLAPPPPPPPTVDAPTEPPPVRQAADHRDHRDQPPPPERPDEASGLSKSWFVGGVGLTLALAGAATWSGLDVLDRHHHYEEEPSEAGYQDGLRRQRRTNILIGAAAASAVTTLTIAYFTRWSTAEHAPSRGISITPVGRGAIVAIDGSF